jgi:hypothetical protein
MSTNDSARSEQSKENSQLLADLHKCRGAVNDIDCMCQTQLGQISSLVWAMLRAMESPDWWKHPDVMADTLGLIKYTADDCMNYVNGMAEAVGSHYVDDFERGRSARIWDAFRKANQKEVENV